MGCVEPMAAAVEDERRTRLLGVGWVNWHNRIGKRFFPVPKIVAGGNAGGPLTTRFECTGMVVSVVAAFVANDLIAICEIVTQFAALSAVSSPWGELWFLYEL